MGKSSLFGASLYLMGKSSLYLVSCSTAKSGASLYLASCSTAAAGAQVPPGWKGKV